jgi:hypothetical protein
MVTVTLTEKEIKQVLADHLNEKLGSLSVSPENISLLVKSKQNYRAEWEEAGVVYTNRISEYIPEVKCEAKG